jgi:hypothetical protein
MLLSCFDSDLGVKKASAVMTDKGVSLPSMFKYYQIRYWDWEMVIYNFITREIKLGYFSIVYYKLQFICMIMQNSRNKGFHFFN